MTKPNIRFKRDDGSDFPDWEEKRLGELGSFTKGASLSKSDISNDGTPFILYGELYTTYDEVAYNIKRKTQAVVDKKYYSLVGDVVIPTSGESPEEISTATCIMVPNVILAGDLNIYRSEKVDGRVISYIINHQAKDKIARIAQGKSIVHIQAKQLEKIRVSYPADEKEQQLIADFLSNVDEVIAASEEEVANLEQQKKAVMQKIFSQEVRFKKEDGSDFPDWEEKKLGELTYPIRVKNKENADLVSYSINNEKGFVPQNEQFKNAGYLNNADRTLSYIVSTGSFAYNPSRINVGSIGYQNLGKDVLVSPLYEIFKTRDNLDDRYLMYWFKTQHFKNNVAKYSEGGVRQSFYYDKLCMVDFALPSLSEQQLIADFLSSYDEAITAAKQELEKWKELKKGLLQQLFV